MSEQNLTPPTSRASQTWDLWYPRIVKAILALGGLGILAHETILTSADRPWLLIAGLGLCGLPVTTALDKMISR